MRKYVHVCVCVGVWVVVRVRVYVYVFAQLCSCVAIPNIKVLQLAQLLGRARNLAAAERRGAPGFA